MNSQTLRCRSLQIFFAVFLLTVFAGTAAAQNFWTNWTATGNPLVLNFTLPDGTTGTVTRTSTSCSTPASTDLVVSAQPHVPAANYPSNNYTPTPPDPVEYLRNVINRDGSLPGCAANNEVVANYVINFNERVANVRFHFFHIDNATFRFFDSASSPIPVTRLSGNTQFEVTGNAVNTTPEDFDGAGCQGPGTNDFIACGSIAVPGKYTQLRMTANDISDSLSGDNAMLTMSIVADYGDAPASYDNNGVNEANHDLLALNLRLGASVDADTAEKSGVTATGDDTTGTDDENGVAGAFPVYQPLGGQVCTGTLGNYTTLANEYCSVISVTNTGAGAGQVVGWLDANGDGDFLDAGERSAPLNDPVIDDGTFATGNVPAGVTRNAILVWTGLPPTLPNTTYLRFRVTRDTSFFSNPAPTGAAIDGEVEDYAALVPSAASVSISGRVLTPTGRGIMGAKVILTDMEGNVLDTISNPFGHYRFNSVPSGATYIITASAKRYVFDTQVVMVKDEIAGLDIIALE